MKIIKICKYQNLKLESLANFYLRQTSLSLQLLDTLTTLVILKPDEILKYVIPACCFYNHLCLQAW